MLRLDRSAKSNGRLGLRLFSRSGIRQEFRWVRCPAKPEILGEFRYYPENPYSGSRQDFRWEKLPAKSEILGEFGYK